MLLNNKKEIAGSPISVGVGKKKIAAIQELIKKLQHEFPTAQPHIKCTNEICGAQGTIKIMAGISNPAFNPPTNIYQCQAYQKDMPILEC